jgi:DNA-binding MarR family transcriptional regulator
LGLAFHDQVSQGERVVGRPPEQEIGLLFDVFVADERVGKLLRLALAPLGLKPMEYAVTSMLATLGPKTPGELAKITAMRPSTLSGYLATLTSRGLVHRAPAPGDGRSAVLELTAEGERIHGAAVLAVRQRWARLRTELRMPVDAVRDALHDLADALDRTIAATEGADDDPAATQ